METESLAKSLMEQDGKQVFGGKVTACLQCGLIRLSGRQAVPERTH